MKDMDRIRDLVRQLDTTRDSLTTIADPATRTAVEEAISVVAQIGLSPSQVAQVKSRDEAIGALTRAMSLLQRISDSNRAAVEHSGVAGD